MFQVVLQFILGLIALLTLAEGQSPDSGNGAAKKTEVVAELDNLLALLPITGTLGTVVKSALTAIAPYLIDLLVAWANKSGFFGKPSSK